LPELNVPVPSEVVPDKNVTVPVAVDGETVAVNVTLAPTVGVVVDEVSVVVVAVLVAALTVTESALEVLVASVVDPP
jgi:RecJ-like exonuclease